MGIRIRNETESLPTIIAAVKLQEHGCAIRAQALAMFGPRPVLSVQARNALMAQVELSLMDNGHNSRAVIEELAEVCFRLGLQAALSSRVASNG